MYRLFLNEGRSRSVDLLDDRHDKCTNQPELVRVCVTCHLQHDHILVVDHNLLVPLGLGNDVVTTARRVVIYHYHLLASMK